MLILIFVSLVWFALRLEKCSRRPCGLGQNLFGTLTTLIAWSKSPFSPVYPVEEKGALTTTALNVRRVIEAVGSMC